MSADSSLDRDSFQQFLANAFVVQESRIHPRFLSAMLNVQRLLANGELGGDGAMNLIVDSARDVAGATGVAVGWLQRDQLIYRAGSGWFAGHVGKRFGASLTVSAKTRTICEILRVEKAHSDSRVEGAICRQFGAESLLILPIYGEEALAGLLMVLFGEAHTFQESEIRTYRLMAGLIETAMCRGHKGVQDGPAELPMSPTAEGTAPQTEECFSEETSILFRAGKDGIYQRCGTALAAVRRSRILRRPRELAETAVKRSTEGLSNNPSRSLILTAVAVAFGLTLWISHGSPRRPSPSNLSALPGSAPASNFQRGDVKPAEGTSGNQSIIIPGEKRKLAAPRSRRMWLGQDEIDYIGDDVTVRHFAYKPAPLRTSGRIAYIGDDVTVRYFTPKPALRSESR